MVIADSSFSSQSALPALWEEPGLRLIPPSGEPPKPEPSPAQGEQAGRWPEGFLLSIVMPVYNERPTIDEIIARVLRLAVPLELIVVDDGSSDGTRERLAAWVERPGVRIVLHPQNAGKGAALRTGLARAQGEIIAVQDADLEYDPAELLALLEPILAGEADVVFGSRFMQGRPAGQLRRHRWANALLTGLSNWLTGLSLTDMETGHKLFRRESIHGLKIEQDRFGVEPELTAKLARRGCRVIELPISYAARDYSQGKKIRFRDALDAVWCILRYCRAT
ncbi:MAG TPA: glycosyltransferase family 2 protein [Pirellulales bacterium]|jgi:glycosyltransferase involved in cell wall biosynthesis|nr:glycosyltransferase family 2 protein [Pirellulales bacterium]